MPTDPVIAASAKAPIVLGLLVLFVFALLAIAARLVQRWIDRISSSAEMAGTFEARLRALEGNDYHGLNGKVGLLAHDLERIAQTIANNNETYTERLDGLSVEMKQTREAVVKTGALLEAWMRQREGERRAGT